MEWILLWLFFVAAIVVVVMDRDNTKKDYNNK
jgi:hypothetical protein